MQRRIHRLALGVPAALGVLALTACGSGFSDSGGGTGDGSLTSSDDALTVLIGSSGDAETAAVNEAVAAWSEAHGTEASVQNANDLNQQLAQGFASGSPADVFYLSADSFAGYAQNGSLLAYGDQLENRDDFYPSLVTNFTYDGDFYCAPKDFSTLGLIIDEGAWAEAGLTDADVPTTWEQLETVARTLTTDTRAGLGVSGEYARVGAFMAQAGGNLMNADSTEATADSPENVEALTYVQGLLDEGVLAYAANLDSGWGGEAFGSGRAAMTIEGNWITGAMANDYPDVDYRIAELPAGPAGQGTLQFTNCWGIAADSPNQEAALDLVQTLTSADSQLAFSEAFGPMPSIQSAAADWSAANPDLVPFLNGADYALGVPTAVGASDVVTDFNAQLETLATGDPAEILARVQGNLEAIAQ